MISATAVMADRQNFASNFVQKFGQNFSQFSRCLYVFFSQVITDDVAYTVGCLLISIYFILFTFGLGQRQWRPYESASPYRAHYTSKGIID